ncbi:MAG: hypothetical protein EVA89_24830 [Sandaracinaceae bacterium]|nr:MAG: hypothetical protein EVA89_24830 [Sandaracinaceae bacterium]HBQ14176.1 hypothetical protein [Myxococcales bacterium]
MSALGLAHVYVLGAVAMTGVGQVLVKQASTRAETGLRIFTSWRLVLGYTFLFGMTLLTQLALHDMTLRELSVWITLTYPLTIGLSALWLEERVGLRELLGLAVLVVGLVVFSLA